MGPDAASKGRTGLHHLLAQMVRFGAVGASAFVIDWGVLALLDTLTPLHYLVSNLVAFTVSTVYNYLLSTRWVFDTDRTRPAGVTLAVFWAMTVVGLGLNSACMWLLVDVVGIGVLLAKVVSTLVVMVYNFIWRKLFLEGRRR